MIILFLIACFTANASFQQVEKVSLLIASTRGARTRYPLKSKSIHDFVDDILTEAPQELVGFKQTFLRLTRMYALHASACYIFLNSILEISNSGKKPREKIAAADASSRRFTRSQDVCDQRHFAVANAVITAIVTTEKLRDDWLRASSDFTTKNALFVHSVRTFKYQDMVDGGKSLVDAYNAISEAGNSVTDGFQTIIRGNVKEWALQQTDYSVLPSLMAQHKRVVMKILEIFAAFRKGQNPEKMDVTLLFVFARWLGIIVGSFGNSLPKNRVAKVDELLGLMRDLSERYQRCLVESQTVAPPEMRKMLFDELLRAMKIFVNFRCLDRRS